LLKSLRRRIRNVLRSLGLDPRRGLRTLRALPWYLRSYRAFKRSSAQSRSRIPLGKKYPCLDDRRAAAGVASGHYFHQDLHVARLIHRNAPRHHVDVGSRVDGFVAHVAVFRKVEVLDIRPVSSTAENISFTVADVSSPSFALTDYCDSLSCLHALEHFGLGRYGDPIDADGHLAAWANLHRMLEPGGKLYVSVPIGPERVEFNAHRVFAVPTLVAWTDGLYRIDSLAYVKDDGDLVTGADPFGEDALRSFGCRYGCGIFELTKLAGSPPPDLPS
jgi:SAM-dependent methyltransferase